MLKRKIKKLTKSLLRRVTGKKLLVCCICGEEEVEVSADTARVTCGRCVHTLVEPPPNLHPKEKSDKPKGWHFKSYFEHNGKVFTKGVEVTDEKEIARLRKEHKVPTKKKVVAKKKTVKKKTTTKKKKGK